MRIGRHMPLASNAVRAMHTARDIGCEAVQIFVTNPRGWRPPAPDHSAEAAFRQAISDLNIFPIVVHATYLINLASPREDIYANSVTLLTATLDRAARYGASSVVFHIGSHSGSGEEAGIARLVAGMRSVLERSPETVQLLVENDVGGGGKLGYRLENLATVLELLADMGERVGVCLDTAHLWGSGFDLGTAESATAVLDQVDRVIGLRQVPVIHLNDTPELLGGKRDHHARVGEGIMPLAGLSAFLRYPRLADATVLLETPIVELASGQPDWDADRDHLARVRALIDPTVSQ